MIRVTASARARRYRSDMDEKPKTYSIADYRALLERAMAEEHPVLVFEDGKLRHVRVPPDYRDWPAEAFDRIDVTGERGETIVWAPGQSSSLPRGEGKKE